MISKVSLFGTNTVKFQGNTNIFDKFKENLNFQTNSNVSLNGNDALANYNKPAVQSRNIDIKPEENIETLIIKDFSAPVKLKDNELETLSGEKIFDDNDQLEAILVKGDNTTKEYHIDDNKITDIIERDNKTGLPIRRDSFGKTYNQNTSAFVQEFDLNSGKLIKETLYNENNLNSITTFNKDKTISNSFENGQLRLIDEKNNDSELSIHYIIDDNNKQAKYAYILDENGNNIKDFIFENGNITKVVEKSYKPLKNIYGITPDNIQLKPAEFIERPDVLNLKGEKTFYPDGAVKTITTIDGNKKTEYTINYDGKQVKSITEYADDQINKITSFLDSGMTNIQEFKNGKHLRTTFYTQDKKLDSIMEFTDDEISKTVDYFLDGKTIKQYSDKNHPEYGSITLEFNKNKELIRVDNINAAVSRTETSF